jgi:hypothetical protein
MATPARQSRIPRSLQAVFLASNRGHDVHQIPTDKAAIKSFRFASKIFGRSSGTASPTSVRATVEDSDDSLAGSSKQLFPPAVLVSPQNYLDALLKQRGYSTERFKTLQTAYYNDPTPLQLASYHVHLIHLVRLHKLDELNELFSCGISPNPCNDYGESLLHKVCRRGDASLLNVMIRNGACLHVADDYGRTPLHDACFTVKPAFCVVEILLSKRGDMFQMLDARGHAPLEYVRKTHWAAWTQFLEQKADVYWPLLCRDNTNTTPQGLPAFCERGPNTRPLRNPSNALGVELCRLVAQGRMLPREAVLLANDNLSDITETSRDSDYDSDYCLDDDDLECGDDYDDEGSYMTSAGLLANLPLGKVMGF